MAARQPFYSTFTEYGEPDYSPSIQYNPKGLPVHSAQLLPLKLPFLPSFIDSDFIDSDAGDDDDELTTADSEQPSPFGAYALFELTRHSLISYHRTVSSTQAVPKTLSSHSHPRLNMVKKRSSLQSIFAPSFLHPSSPSTTTSRMRSSSSASVFPYASSASDISHYATLPRRNSPPPDLIDDDPFANLSSPRPSTSTAPAPPSPPRSSYHTPRSPLSLKFDKKAVIPSSPIPASPALTRTISSGRVHALSAHKKPAFKPRPSLPSLHTLAQMNLVFPGKVRKGTVGAGLPFEPWDDQCESIASGLNTPAQILDSPEEQASNSQPIVEEYFTTSPISVNTMLSQIPDFNSDADFMDLSDDDGDQHEFFTASPEDEDIDIGLDYSYGCNLEVPPDVPTPPALSRKHSSDLGHSYSGSTSSISSVESLVDELSFPSHSMRKFSLSPEDSYGDESDYPSSPPDDFISDSYLAHGDAWGCTPTPPSSMFIPNDPDIVEPGTSVDTITLRTIQSHRRSTTMSRDYEWLTHDFVDGDSWEERGRGSSRRNDSSGWAPSGNGNGSMDKRSGYGGSNGGHWNGAGGGGENGDDRRSNQPRRNVSSFDSEESTSESESEDESHGPAPGAVEHDTDDDDVPLAQRIPTALKAQRTIRLKAREERDQRRKERAAARSRQATLRPAGAAAPVPQVLSSSHEAALHASKSVRRPRTQTISGTGAHMPFAVEDLAQRLHTVQAAPAPIQQGRERMRSVSPDPPAPKHTLRPMRSFHRPERQRVDDHQAVPMPADTDQMVRRSNTRAKSRTRADSVSAKARTFSSPAEEPLPALPIPRRSVDERATTKLVKPRTSTEQSSVSSSPLILSKGNISQQRIFIGDRQRFNMVEVGPSTNAGQVIEMVEAQGSLKGWVGSGAWMLFEVAQDFGMERPIRSFELLSDVEASWNKDKMVNIFVVKLTPLAHILSRSAIPTSSPVHSGWVEWEIKRGKWTKRWLALREHSLFLSKRERGKDETLLCSLSNFDAYTVIRVHKSPKPYVFAIKSTDNISFFENTADYLHIFSCSKSDGELWMEKILLARSYVLHQERNVLFNPKASGGNSAGSALSRAPTRKGVPPSHKPAPQTLVDVRAPDIFEPGSLLQRK